ncbi:Rv1733c family protein [Streptomyces brasiliensis]|uniref:Membrane protein SCJ1.26 n=1 Tax=Streptomyces brasiliensis TaxID=1954 RepID=A0A917NKA2_9ACTN|nr:hypothetical protein [Streptomyces brasiliensis]GGJ06778.1 hypothetical protein GCM10010121_016550 [Streptomyces brasiliensis]
MRKARRTTIRGWRWRRNPLRRRSDVVEAWIVLATWTTALLGSAAAGTAGALAMDGAVRQAQAERHPASAVLVDTLPVTTDGRATGRAHDRATATVRWTDGAGRVRTGDTAVRAGTAPGTRMTVWTGPDGRLVAGPIGPAAAAARVGLAGTGVALGTGLLVMTGGRVVRLRVERRATEQWGVEWDRVGRQQGPRTSG